MYGRLFRFEISRTEGRCKLFCDLAVFDGVGFSGDASIPGVQGVVPNLNKQLQVFILCEVYVWQGLRINMLDAPRWVTAAGN